MLYKDTEATLDKDIEYMKSRYNELEPCAEKETIRRGLIRWGVKFDTTTGDAK